MYQLLQGERKKMEIYTVQKLAVLQLKRIRNFILDNDTNMYAVSFVANGYVTLEGGLCTAHWNNGVCEILDVNDIDNLIDMAIDSYNKSIARENDLEYISF